jgi:hypothetical protein
MRITLAQLIFADICNRIIIFLADTWLHITTTTVNFVQVSQVETDANYSFVLLPPCTVGNIDPWINCSLNIPASGADLINATQSLQVLNNVSDVMSALTYESNPPYTYLGIPPSDQISQRDYTATTFGMNTQCKPISTECNLNGMVGAYTPFRCNDAFQGDLTQGPSWQMAYFNDSNMTSNVTYLGIHNPYYFGLATREIYPGYNYSNLNEIVGPLHGGIAFVLFCTVRVYDVEYDSVNGTVTRFVATASNDSVANIWQGPMARVSLGPGTTNLQQATNLAILSNSSQEIADKIALAYSLVALAVGSQAVGPYPAVAAQERQSFLVSRVPAAPLFTLVIANLLFVLLGIILTSIAIWTSGGEVREVQARLSIGGLVADRFEEKRGKDGIEKMDDSFEEKDGNGSMRVAIDRGNGGGYTYKVWPKSGVPNRPFDQPEQLTKS